LVHRFETQILEKKKAGGTRTRPNNTKRDRIGEKSVSALEKKKRLHVGNRKSRGQKEKNIRHRTETVNEGQNLLSWNLQRRGKGTGGVKGTR